MANVKATDLIDFTRASKGHALAKVSYGSEEVTNGTFDSDSDWFKQTGWSISNGTANYDGTGGTSSISQNPTTNYKLGSVYQLSLEVISNQGSGFNTIYVSTTQVVNSAHLDVGTHVFTFIPTSTDAHIFIYGRSGESFSIDNVSVKEILFDQPDGTIQLFEHPNNVPRIEYDADGNLLGLLIEEARTNEVTHSEDFGVFWQKVASGTGTTPVVTADYAPAPYSASGRASRLQASKTSGTGYSLLQVALGNYTGDSSGSLWVKSNTGSNQTVYFRSGSIGAEEKTVTTEWTRLETTVTLSAGQVYLSIGNRDNIGSEDLDILIWGAQLEKNSFVTSYIKTTGSTVTRSADVASIDVDQFGYNQSEGTVTVEANAPDGSNQNRLTQLVTSGGATNRVVDLYRVTNDIVMYNGTTTITGNAFAASNDIKAAGAYKSGSYALVSDGGSVIANSDATVYIPNTLTIGMNGASSRQLNGHIKSITYTPKRLSNAKLQELTS